MECYPLVNTEEGYESFYQICYTTLVHAVNVIFSNPYTSTTTLISVWVMFISYVYSCKKTPKKVFQINIDTQKILDQVGNDRESWPVILVDQIILLQEEIHKLQNM
jgi:hypothetical protein